MQITYIKTRWSMWAKVLCGWLLSLFWIPTIVWAQTEQVVGNLRVQALSPSLVRIELRGPNGFENRNTFHVVQRSWPGSTLTSSLSGNTVVLSTSSYSVRIPANATTLDGITIHKPDGTQVWSMPSAERYTTLKNRWKGTYLFDSGDAVAYGASPTNDSYFWAVEKVDGYSRFRNKATGDYLNIEHLASYVESTPVQTYWHSKDWTLEPVDIAGYFRLRSRWAENPHYIHVEDQLGYAQHIVPGATNSSGASIDTWTSAQWEIDEVSFFTNNRQWLPHPRATTQAWALVDTPRMVPAPWGYAYPGTAQINNGWDLNNDAADVYVFLPNGDGKKLRRDFIELTGHSELIPLYALGGWDSRYYAYTQAEALAKIDKYRAKNIPLDVFVVDTDWRIGASSGYGVNTSLFPDMPGFLAAAHAKNVRVPFNDHPEPRAMALEPVEVQYRNEGLRSLFAIGMDFWWFDRNWHVTLEPPPGINKETFGMYVYDSVIRDHFPNRRPIIMANVDGIDNGVINKAPDIAAHRFTMQWTGDTTSDYDSLKREIRAAVYSGVFAPFAYTSTDLGGHKGTLTVEQYARWVQFGALSPIFRLHCGQGFTRDPWDYAAPAESVVRKFVQMRMRLLPLFYALARDNHETGEPILRRLDLDYPGYAEAARDDQYLLGKDILVAPIAETGTSRSAWIPPGTWINLWDGSTITGPVTTNVSAGVEQMPLFVKRGALVALAPDMQHTAERRWDPVTLDVYPLLDNTATTALYEDDGISNAYKTGAYRKTALSSTVNNANKTITLRIAAASGTYSGAQANRSWKIRVRTPSEWGSLVPINVTENGIVTAWNDLAKNVSSMPFQVNGGAADSAINEISLASQAVTSERSLVISYGPASLPPGTNLARNKPVTGSSACNANEGPEKAVNGSVAGGNSDKFCSGAASRWLQVDLGASYDISGFVVKHAGAGGEDGALNTRDFTIELSADNVTWTTVKTVTNNVASTSVHTIGTTKARYARINLTTPSQTTGSTVARLYEFEVYGSGGAFTLKVEAESYSNMAGVQTEATTDVDGGLNVGWIDANDWMAYANANFPTSGSYKVEYRVASPNGAMLSLDLNAGAIQLGQLAIPATGGWQNWTTISHNVTINAGTYAVGLFAPQGGWNINWIRFTKL